MSAFITDTNESLKVIKNPKTMPNKEEDVNEDQIPSYSKIA